MRQADRYFFVSITWLNIVMSKIARLTLRVFGLRKILPTFFTEPENMFMLKW